MPGKGFAFRRYRPNAVLMMGGTASPPDWFSTSQEFQSAVAVCRDNAEWVITFGDDICVVNGGPVPRRRGDLRLDTDNIGSTVAVHAEFAYMLVYGMYHANVRDEELLRYILRLNHEKGLWVRPSDKARRKWSVTSKGKRVSTTLGRILRRRMGIDSNRLSDAAMRRLQDVLNNTLWPDAADFIKVVRGKEVMAAYKAAVGAHSCMTESNADKVELYADNPDKVGLLVYDDGRYQARAVVWNTDEGETVIDRIYPNNSPIRDAIITYAKEHKWVYRLTDGADDRRLSTQKALHVTVQHHFKFPYMDTFIWAAPTGENAVVLSNREPSANEHGTLQSTTGRWSNLPFHRCHNCGSWFYRAGLTYKENGNTHYMCVKCATHRKCARCGRTGALYRVNVQWVCGECAGERWYCSVCGHYHSGNTERYVYADRDGAGCSPGHICEKCGRRFYYTSALVDGECVLCRSELA